MVLPSLGIMGLFSSIGQMFWGRPRVPAGETEEPRRRDPLREWVQTAPRMPAFFPWMDNLQNLDETSDMRCAYRAMLASPNIKSALHSKILDVIALDLEIAPADKDKPRDVEVAKFVDWNLQKRFVDGKLHLMWNILMHGAIDGISVNTTVWADQDRGKWKGKRVLRDVKWVDIDQDAYLDIDEYKNIIGLKGVRYNAGQEYNPADFIIYKHLSLFDNPGGTSDLRAAYGPWWMLDTVFKLRGEGARRAAFPMPVGEYKDPTKKIALEIVLANAEALNWAAVPEDTKLKTIDLAAGSEAYFASFRRDCQEEIFLSIQGSHLQALGAAKGSGGLGHGGHATHKDTSEIWKQAVAEQFCALLNNQENGLIKLIVDANYADVDDYPTASLSKVNLDEQLQRAQILQILLEGNFPASKTKISEEFRMPLGEDEEDTLQAVQVRQTQMSLDHEAEQKDLDRQHTEKQGDKERQHSIKLADKAAKTKPSGKPKPATKKKK